jgi:phosphoglycolate phosphatase-like HAD superfamily hydrolase
MKLSWFRDFPEYMITTDPVTMTIHTSYRSIILDCDGVVFDSNGLKTQAFRQVLADYPSNAVENFIEFHQCNGGISRFIKLRYFFTDFLHVEVDEMALQRLLEDFSCACLDLYSYADLTPGCIAFLKQARYSGIIPLYIASGSAEAELNEVFAKRDLSVFFEGILGSPKSKEQCVSQILKILGFKEDIILVGDALADWKAAKLQNIRFIFMAQFSEARDSMLIKAKEENFKVIQNLQDLLPLPEHSSHRTYKSMW